jgi:hypothetical protein
VEHVHAPKSPFPNLYLWGATSVFVLGLLHSAVFRRGVLTALWYLWRAVRGVCYDLPLAFQQLPWVRAVLQSRPYLIFYLLVFKPLLWAAWLPLALYWIGAGPAVVIGAAVASYLVAALLLNSRLGQQVEEMFADGLMGTWEVLRVDVMPGLFRWVVFVFKLLVEQVDRLLYTVDEWLRFQTGDSRLSLVVKPVLGLLWFVVSYVVRFAVNLLIEPQINPIKHFPVVTVSHKVLLPLTFTARPKEVLSPFGGMLANLFGLGIERANAVAFTIVWGIPGIFGFLAWELKENWRLYRANESPTLDPVLVGSHGETVLRLLRPGFHSGTVPKLYAKLRRGERRREGKAIRKQREALHHVAEAVRHFVERGLAAVLAGSKSWGALPPPRVGAITLATRRIHIELGCPLGEGPSVFLDVEEHEGWLVAGFGRDAGWLARLTPDQRLALSDTLAGFYKLAGIRVVREQVETVLLAGVPYAVADGKLVVYPGPGFETVAAYDLGEEGPELRPRAVVGPLAPALPVLAAEQVLFSRTPLRWDAWVEAWERDQDGKGHEPPLAPAMRLLPV